MFCISTIASIGMLITLVLTQTYLTASKRFAFFSIHIESWLVIIKDWSRFLVWYRDVLIKILPILLLFVSSYYRIILLTPLNKNLLEVSYVRVNHAKLILFINALLSLPQWWGSFCSNVSYWTLLWWRWIVVLSRWRYFKLPWRALTVLCAWYP